MELGEHVEILQKGCDAWHQWRKETSWLPMYPDFSNGKFSGMDFTDCNLRGAIFDSADLSNTNLSRASLVESRLHNADLRNSHLKQADFNWADLSHAKLDGIDFGETNISWAKFNGASIKDSFFVGGHWTAPRFNGADLSGSNFNKCSLEGAEFIDATLNGVSFSGAVLYGVSFRGADMSGTIFAWTTLANVVLAETVGLETADHDGPSSFSFDTYLRSEGDIPLDFLRGIGLPEPLILYMPSLTQSAVQFYSCFISYSSLDAEFVTKLHSDLQSKGVRCWFAPEDMRIGDKIRGSIDRQIRLNDKLLLVLSSNSIRSNWVEAEVEAAFAKESEQDRLVMFPIMLDSTVFDTSEAWAKHIKDTRHIGDFRSWKDTREYQRSFLRLLKDLNRAN